MDERLQFVARRLAGEAMADLCREFGISRESGYKILVALAELQNTQMAPGLTQGRCPDGLTVSP